jgi:hypothetical protein
MTTELDEMQAMLERVLRDPTGFADRMLGQIIARVRSPDGQQLVSGATMAADATSSASVIRNDQPAKDDTPLNTNVLLAAALGACECWGFRAGCGMCQGQGVSGWTQPDPALFDEFVKPAITRMRNFES